MKIGFYTSTFNDRPFEEVADFAEEAGFDAIEIDVGGHIKTPDRVADAVKIARDRGLFVASITFFGNQLDADARPPGRAARPNRWSSRMRSARRRFRFSSSFPVGTTR